MIGSNSSDSESRIVHLTRNELLVLSDLLHRWMDEESSPRNVRLEYQAEQRALWDLAMKLEDQNDIVFSEDYDRMMDEARKRVQDSEAGPNDVGLKMA